MTAKHRDIVARLTPAQYEALAYAVAHQSAELEQDGSKADLAVLNRGWDSIKTAWTRAGMGF